MSKQHFENNLSTTLNATLNAGATSLTLAADGALIPAILGGTGWFVEFTLDDGAGVVEVVYARSHTAASDTFTGVLRGQQGTSDLTWSAGSLIEARLTQGTLEDLIGTARFDVNGNVHTALGTSALDIQTERALPGDVAGGTQSVALGSNVAAVNHSEIAIGSDLPIAAGGNVGIRIGNDHVVAGGGSNQSLAIGSLISSGSHSYSVLIGSRVALDEYGTGFSAYNTLVGDRAQMGPNTYNNVQIGYGFTFSGNRNVAIGLGSYIPDGQTYNDVGLTHIAATHWVPQGDAPGSLDRIQLSGARVVLVSPSVNLTAVANFSFTPNFPSPAGGFAGAMFYPDEVGLILTTQPATNTAPTVTTLPTIRMGTSSVDDSYLAATVASGLTALGHRQVFTPATRHGSRSLGYGVTAAGTTGGQLWGRFYFSGFVTGDS
jgi:hypothetical protein